MRKRERAGATTQAMMSGRSLSSSVAMRSFSDSFFFFRRCICNASLRPVSFIAEIAVFLPQSCKLDANRVLVVTAAHARIHALLHACGPKRLGPDFGACLHLLQGKDAAPADRIQRGRGLR